MGKVIKSSTPAGFFPQGGSGHMFGPGGATPSTAGQSAHTSQPGKGAKWPTGGNGHMFGKGHASPMPAGQSSKTSQ